MAVVHTMVEEIELQDTPRAKAILRGILEPSEVWDKLPVKRVKTLQVQGRRWKSLPTVSFAHIGEAYGSGGGKTEAVSYGLKHLGHDIDIPKVYDEDTAHIVDPRALQTEMVLTSLSYLLNNTLVNGDEAVDPRAFSGLKVISAALASRQTLDAALVANGGDGTSLVLTAGGASDTIRHAFLDLLAKAHRRLERSTKTGSTNGFAKGALMMMNENLYDLFESIVRRAGLLKITEDQFERTVNTWRGMAFVDAGFANMDGTSYVISDTHDGGNNTSLYFMLLDPEKHVGVLQTRGIDVRKLGELHTNATNRYRMDWTFGVVCWGKRSIVRVKGLRVA